MTVSQGASSLFEKYTALNNSIASTRADIQLKQRSIEALESKIAILQTSTRSDENKSLTARKEIENLTQTLQSKTQKLLISKEEEPRMKSDLEMLHRMTHQLLGKRDRCRLEFLTTCRDFRLKVKHARVKLKAFDDDAAFSNDGTEGKETDDVLNRALVIFKTSYENRNLALQRLEQGRKQREGLQLRSIERSKTLEQQKLQLNRIRKAVVDMEKEIMLLNENTKECEEMSGGFAKDAARRRQNQRNGMGTVISTSTPHCPQHFCSDLSAVTPSPCNATTTHSSFNQTSTYVRTKVLDNPYRSKTDTSNETSSHGFIQNPYNNDANKSYTINTAESFIKQQYPHREGRIRVDRQFSTVITIGDCSTFSSEKNGGATSVAQGLESSSSSSDNDDDDELLTFTPFGSH